MTELLVAEIGRKPSDRSLNDREGYSLAAGFALGCVCLGLGAEAPGLADLQLHTWLLRYVHGGAEMSVPGAAARDQKDNPNHDPATCSSLLQEPEGINMSVTSAGGCVALGLVFLRTGNEAVASRIVIPQNVFQLDYVRPDFAMLRLVARCLIMWEGIEASDAWVDQQVPPFLLQLESAALAAGRSEDHDGRPGALGRPQTPAGSPPDIDWLLVGQTRASLAAGACLAVGLRFAGTGDAGAKRLLIARLQQFRDARRNDAHPALMASQPTPGMDLDRSTLETCQSALAVALGMVMAGTGDLSALKALRSLRKKADQETSYGVHMATHMAIGFVFLGGGRYTFGQDPVSIAALLMATFPRFPTALTDNRCHLQAFRNLYVLAAKPRGVEAVEVETQQPVDLQVLVETSRGTEPTMLSQLMLTSDDVQSVTLQSEGYWPVTIRRPLPGTCPAAGRWLRSLEACRRLHVKRRSGQLPDPQDPAGAQAASQVAGVALDCLRRAAAEGGCGSEPCGPGPAEYAAALCCAPPPLLPAGACSLDFEDGGSLCERLAPLLRARAPAPEVQAARGGEPQAPHARYGRWLQECVAGSKLCAYPLYLRIYLQTQHADAGLGAQGGLSSGLPAAPCCSAAAMDQLASVEHFYNHARRDLGAQHPPLLSEGFLASRGAALRGAFAEGGALAGALAAALRGPGGSLPLTAAATDGAGELAAEELVSMYLRLHGLPRDLSDFDMVLGDCPAVAMMALPRLRRAFPDASVQGLQKLLAALSDASVILVVAVAYRHNERSKGNRPRHNRAGVEIGRGGSKAEAAPAQSPGRAPWRRGSPAEPPASGMSPCQGGLPSALEGAGDAAPGPGAAAGEAEEAPPCGSGLRSALDGAGDEVLQGALVELFRARPGLLRGVLAALRRPGPSPEAAGDHALGTVPVRRLQGPLLKDALRKEAGGDGEGLVEPAAARPRSPPKAAEPPGGPPRSPLQSVNGVLAPGYFRPRESRSCGAGGLRGGGTVVVASGFVLRGIQRLLVALVEGREEPYADGLIDKPHFLDAAASKRGAEQYSEFLASWPGRRLFKTHALPSEVPFRWPPTEEEVRGDTVPKVAVLVSDPRYALSVTWEAMILMGIDLPIRGGGRNFADFVDAVVNRDFLFCIDPFNHFVEWAREAVRWPGHVKLFEADRFASQNPKEVAAVCAEFADFIGIPEPASAAARLVAAIGNRPGNASLALARDDVPNLDAIRGGPLVELLGPRVQTFESAAATLSFGTRAEYRRLLGSMRDVPMLAALAQRAIDGVMTTLPPRLCAPLKGAAAHAAGTCRPCVFALRGACRDAAEMCAFCHLPGHARPKRPSHNKRAKLSARKSQARCRTPSVDGLSS
ncbi:unnamed protein product [Prorocentrum cordatum]|uniref:Anaphase-promoting complex subunit 1 n=1 Tax=Prorocentrum cordatum TaxID=2364126 RepID=A0ABN9PH35_9DINO|nr:unnamed protein product [Polarella glacialis]